MVEFPEFPRHVPEALRQPMKDGFVVISRANGKLIFPSKFILFTARNPCPCGYLGDTTHECRCNAAQILRYQKRVSGPMLDRIDIHLDVTAVKVEKLTAGDNNRNESLQVIGKRTELARSIQIKRYKQSEIKSNTEMTNRDIKTFCQLSDDCLTLLKSAVLRMRLSARSY